jgi:pentatricopeptide repeat protein
LLISSGEPISTGLEIFDEMIQMKKADMYSFMTVVKPLNITKQYNQVLKYFQRVKKMGLIPDQGMFVSVFPAIKYSKNKDLCQQIYKEMIDMKIQLWNTTQGQLMELFGTLGDLSKVSEIFECLQRTRQVDVICWNIFINTLVQNKKPREAVDCYYSMIHQGFHPDPVTFTFVLSAITQLKDLQLGKNIHQQMIDTQLPITDHHFLQGN